jgi:hypothetical protein
MFSLVLYRDCIQTKCFVFIVQKFVTKIFIVQKLSKPEKRKAYPRTYVVRLVRRFTVYQGVKKAP